MEISSSSGDKQLHYDANIPCLVRIQRVYSSLTVAERRVADHVMDHAADVVTTTITEVAKQSEVGVGTVGRLCSKLGYSGFPAMKIALATELTIDDASNNTVWAGQDAHVSTVHQLMQGAIRNLQDSAVLLDTGALTDVVSRLKSASWVTVYALSPVDQSVAQLLAYRLLQLQISCVVLNTTTQQDLHAQAIQAGETIVIVSSASDNSGLVYGFEQAADMGCLVVLMTNALQSPSISGDHVTLNTARHSTRHPIDDALAYIGMFALVDVLYGMIAVEDDVFASAEQMLHTSLAVHILDELRIAVPYLPNTMDPQQLLGIANGRIYPLVFSTLINRDWTGSDWKLIPGLASSWKRQDEFTLDLTLRTDVQWHDGMPFGVDDVVYTFERIQSGASELHVARSGFWPIERVEALNDSQVRMITFEPDPFLEMRLASHHVAYILPAHHHQAVGDQAFAAGNTIGTGPYRLQKWVDGDYMTFAANEAYYGGQPGAKHLVVVSETDTEERTDGLIRGQYDLITDVSPEDMEMITRHNEFQAKSEIVGLDYELLFNMQAAPLDRREIRQALSLAIDRQYIIDELWKGFAVYPRGSQIPGENYYDPDRARLPYNPQRAHMLLEKGGYKGEVLVFAALKPDYYILDGAMVEAIAAMWREVDVKVEFEFYKPLGERTKHVTRGNTHHHIFEVSTGSYNDMHQRLVGMWGKNSDFQRTHFWLPESAQRYNDLIDELAATHDPVARRNIYRKLLDELEYEVPGTPILIPELIYAMQGHIHIAPNNYQGLDLSPANFHVLDKGDG